MKRKYLSSALAISLILSSFIYKMTNKGIDLTSMDKSVKPTDDFFNYVNGNWIKNNPIPASEARWGSFIVLDKQNSTMLRKILEDVTTKIDAPQGSIAAKIRDFYKTAMDTLKLEKDGIKPVMPLLDEVSRITSNKEIIPLLSSLHRRGIGGLFNMYIAQDVNNNERYMVWFAQGGLGLPDKDYYSKQDEKSKRIRDEYVKHLNKMCLLYGMDEATATTAPNQILQFETTLAAKSRSRVENRNMEKKYNLRSLKVLKDSLPNLNWDEYFRNAGLAGKGIDTVIISQPEYFEYINGILESEPLENLKSYLRWKVMSATSGYLNEAASKQTFYFYGTVITGTKEQKPRWERMVSSANRQIGELVAQEYVKTAFSAESKRRVNEMVDNLREAFRMRIQSLEWMSPETKLKALEKLGTFNRKLGYPDKWKDYSKLNVGTESYLANYLTSNEFESNDDIDKLGKPVDKTEWNMLPQTVNAYYNPVMNEIVFPAAIMQPPFFNADADDAVNYGAIGAVIGHEFSHGFDDQGSKYDAKGNLKKWWTDDDRKKFEARTKVLVNQFSAYKVADSVFVNGELTLGENIADIAGLLVAYDAFQISLKGKKKVKIDGFTPEQRFFIGFAQVWRGHSRPEYVRNQVLTDPHSPQQFRVLGPLSNMQAFYNAFNVKKGDKMWKDDSTRVKIW